MHYKRMTHEKCRVIPYMRQAGNSLTEMPEWLGRTDIIACL